jgi:hypothetical protein
VFRKEKREFTAREHVPDIEWGSLIKVCDDRNYNGSYQSGLDKPAGLVSAILYN